MSRQSGDPATPQAPQQAVVYLLYDQGHVLSAHSSAEGAQGARAAAVAHAKQELADPDLEHLVDHQVAIVEQPLLP